MFILVSQLYWPLWILTGSPFVPVPIVLFLLSFAWRIKVGNWWFKIPDYTKERSHTATNEDVEKVILSLTVESLHVSTGEIRSKRAYLS